ncbi:hypothetical protein ACP70R_005495 [Stipagrostis hirtigluma subsp. patula]
MCFAIKRLEVTKYDLQIRTAEKARGNSILQSCLERRKQAMHERRVALEHDVCRILLQEQLQTELGKTSKRDLRAALETGLSMSSQVHNSRLASKMWTADAHAEPKCNFFAWLILHNRANTAQGVMGKDLQYFKSERLTGTRAQAKDLQHRVHIIGRGANKREK